MARSENLKDRIPLIVGIFLLIVYTLGIFDHDLWTPDEPRVASIARQVSEGAWVVPTLNGSPFLEQPPLYVWCVALVYKLFGCGHPEIGRAVSAFFGLGGLLWTYLFAFHLARARGRTAARRIGALAALTLGLSMEYLTTAHRVVVDSALTFFTTGSAYAILRGLTARHFRPGTGWLLLGYAFASLSFLSKGLIGLAVPAIAFLSILFTVSRRKLFFHSRLWLALLCFLIFTGPWFYFLYVQLGLEGFKEVFVNNTLGRILPGFGGGRGHVRPIYYYMIYLPLHLMPATIFVAGGLLRRFRKGPPLDETERSAYNLVFAWLAMGFLMLSLASTKRAVYLVPFFPAAAIAGGFWLDSFLARTGERFYENTVGYLLAVLLVIMAVSLPTGAVLLKTGAVPEAALGALVTIVIAAGVLRASIRRNREAALLFTVLGMLATFVSALLFPFPAIDGAKSLRTVSKRIASLVPEGRPLYAIKPDETTEAMLPLYAGKHLTALSSADKIKERQSREGEVYLLAVNKKHSKHRSPQWEKDALESLSHLPHEILLESVGTPGISRMFRLVRIHNPGK